jgi:hypothetical protein
MPWHVARTDQCPASRPWGVILNADGRVVDGGCHSAHDMANRHLAALYANEPQMSRGRDELLEAAAPFLTLPHLREQSRDHLGRFGSGGGGPDPASMHTVAAIRATYDYTDPVTGFSAMVRRPTQDGDPQRSTYVTIEIRDRKGKVIGSAERTIHASGQASVLHGGLALEPPFQGQGFATRWNQQVEGGYRANGIKQIHTHASGGKDMNGSYTWARAGYEFGDAGSRGDVARRFETAAGAARFHQGGPEIHAAVTKLVADPHASPIEFAMIGWSPGATTWFGKETILQVSWEGVKTL